jgi:DNA-binding response OmpR family regulator
LPNFNGWEILRKIKKDDSFKDLKVVVLSNLGEKDEVEKGLKLGATKYLVKAHYTPSEVIKEVKKIL